MSKYQQVLIVVGTKTYVFTGPAIDDADYYLEDGTPAGVHVTDIKITEPKELAAGLTWGSPDAV